MSTPLSASMPTSFCLYAITVQAGNNIYAVQPGSSDSGSQLRLAEYSGNLSQQWMFVVNTTFGGYSIYNAETGYCIDAAGNSNNPGNGTEVQQYEWQEQQNQTWNIVQQSTDPTQFQLTSSYKSNMIWNVQGGKIGSGYKIQLYKQDLQKSSSNQFFNLIPVANQYGCDLGFDWAGTTSSGSLQANLMAKPYNNPAWFTQFSAGDTLALYLYDISQLNNSAATPASSPTINFKMSFTNVSDGSAAQPFGLTSYNPNDECYEITGCCGSTQYSQAFGMTLPVYMIGTGSSPQVWQLGSSAGKYNFVFTATVTVVTMSPKTFVFDPEMIVGPATSA